MSVRLRAAASQRRQSHLSHIRRRLHLGGALAALGLLTQCSLDEDIRFFPRYAGTYLRTDSLLWWLPDSGVPIRLPVSVRSITGSPWGLIALAADGQVIYHITGSEPVQSIPLNESCTQVRTFWESSILCLACTSGLRLARSSNRAFRPGWETIPQPGGITHVAAAPSFILASGERVVQAYEPQRFARVADLSLPGPVEALWIEHPTGGAGRWGDTITQQGSFSYLHSARRFSYDPAQRALRRQTSPYLKRDLGTEYTGAVTLSMDSVLTPGGHAKVRSYAVDFLSGTVTFLRSDTVWRYAVSEPQRLTFIGHFPGTKEIEAVAVYRYGSAEVTTR